MVLFPQEGAVHAAGKPAAQSCCKRDFQHDQITRE